VLREEVTDPSDPSGTYSQHEKTLIINFPTRQTHAPPVGPESPALATEAEKNLLGLKPPAVTVRRKPWFQPYALRTAKLHFG
jgi:hypothetical protein